MDEKPDILVFEQDWPTAYENLKCIVESKCMNGWSKVKGILPVDKDGVTTRVRLRHALFQMRFTFTLSLLFIALIKYKNDMKPVPADEPELYSE